MASGRIVLTQVIYLVPIVKCDIPSNSRLTLQLCDSPKRWLFWMITQLSSDCHMTLLMVT